MIVHNVVKKEDGQICLCTILAIRAQPIEIESVADNLVTRGPSNLLDQVLGQANLWIQDLLAVDADQVGMGIRLVAVVAVVAIAETQFQHLVYLFQDIQGFVDSRQARRRELLLDLVVQIGCAGMSVAGCQQPQQGDALRCQSIFALTELVDQLFKPGLWIHRTAFSIKS
jgi:hypothetical protein